MLTNAEREKFSYVKLDSFENEKIDYFLTHYLFGVNDNELEMKGFVSWYDVIVNDIKISSIYIKKK